jgi:WD40 repeat protein
MSPIAWKSDSTQLATVGGVGLGDERVFIYDVQTGNHALELSPSGNIRWAGWSADDSQIAMVTNQGLEVWDLALSPPSATLPLLPQADTAIEINFSPESHQVAFVNYQIPNEIQIWDTDTRQLVRSLLHDDKVTRLHWGSGGIISKDRSGALRVWDPATGTQLAFLPLDLIVMPRWNPDGTIFVATDSEHGVHTRNGLTGELISVLGGADTLLVATQSN